MIVQHPTITSLVAKYMFHKVSSYTAYSVMKVLCFSSLVVREYTTTQYRSVVQYLDRTPHREDFRSLHHCKHVSPLFPHLWSVHYTSVDHLMMQPGTPLLNLQQLQESLTRHIFSTILIHSLTLITATLSPLNSPLYFLPLKEKSCFQSWNFDLFVIMHIWWIM